MTSEIELKRKELEDEHLYFSLEYFNLGVQLAQKEFLDKIDKIRDETRKDGKQDGWDNTEYYKGYIASLWRLHKELRRLEAKTK